MKTRILFTLMTFLFLSFQLFSQDTIIGWTFPTASLADTLADQGIPANLTNYIKLVADTPIMFTTMSKASPPASAQAMGMSDATAQQKGWYIRVNTKGYESLKLYSKQNACMTHSGPKYWKVQFKLGASPWTDVPNSNLECGLNWTKGVLNGVGLPLMCYDYPDVQLRWITTSDSNVSGALNGTVFVTDTSMSRIDDIFITGTKIPYYGDTVAAWTFPTGTLADSLANFGIPANLTSAIHLKSDSLIKYFTGTYASPPACAQAMGLENATALEKGWYIQISTKGYDHLKIFSKQNACKMHSAPKYWKLQYSVVSGTWVDVRDITCGLNWTTGIVKDVSLPQECNNKDILKLRWVVVSDSNVPGSTIGPAIVNNESMARIDDIYIFGNLYDGISPDAAKQNIGIYPNPVSGTLHIQAEGTNEMQLFNILGELIYECTFKDIYQIETSAFTKGIYMVTIKNDESSTTRKILIQ